MRAKIVAYRFAAPCLVAVLGANTAEASPIDNSGNSCHFRFDQNTNIPFLSFSSRKKASNIPGNCEFIEDTLSDGAMANFDGMTDVPTDLTYSGDNIHVRLFFEDVEGTTDLSVVDHSAVDWTITAHVGFLDQSGTMGITTKNCKTSNGSISIDIVGDWQAIQSATFTIPTVSGCNGHASALNTDLGLGSSGASLTLYKFTGQTSAGVTLTGSDAPLPFAQPPGLPRCFLGLRPRDTRRWGRWRSFERELGGGLHYVDIWRPECSGDVCIDHSGGCPRADL